MKPDPIISATVAALLVLVTVPAISQATTYTSNTTISGTVTDTSVSINSGAIVDVVAGGIWNASGGFLINDNGNANSTAHVNGGILNYAGGGDGFQVGWWYGGRFNISAGEANFSSLLRMYNGDVNITGGTLNLLSHNLQIGEYNDSLTNSFSISGGIANIKGVQYDGGGGGQYNLALSGTGTLSIGSNGIAAGSGKPGTLNFSGGTLMLDTGAILRPFGTNGSFDMVDNLLIGGVAQSAGVWGGIGSGAANETSLIQNGDTLTVLSTVPEPGAFAMLLLGSLTFWFMRRQRVAVV